MKKLFLIIYSLLLVSCVDLNEKPDSFLTSNQFFNNEADALAAVNSVYHRMFTEWLVLYNRQLMMFEMATDDVTSGPRTRSAQVIDLSQLNHVPNNTAVEWTWQYTYDAINRANIAIENIARIPADKIDETVRKRLINEAKFLRGWNYLNLVRWFGPVPLILKETTSLSEEDLYVGKSSEEEIYEQVFADLGDAEELPAPGFYGASDAGRATAGAAKTLLIKAHLTRKEWQLAANKAKELILELGWYDLYDNFKDVFDAKTKNGKEHIFSIQYNGDPSLTNGLAHFSLPFEVNGEYVDAPYLPGGLYESYLENDERRDVTFAKSLIDPGTGETINLQHLAYVKYWDTDLPFAPTRSSKNVPLLRYADVLLMYAEALNELGETAEAYEYIDLVRGRAKTDLLKDISPDLTIDEFREAVFEERRKELALEYHRWFDLSRRGPEVLVQTLHAVGKTNAAPRHVRFPVPQRELDLNPKLGQHLDWIGF